METESAKPVVTGGTNGHGWGEDDLTRGKFWSRLQKHGIVIHEKPVVGTHHLMWSERGQTVRYMPHRLIGVIETDRSRRTYNLNFEGAALIIPATHEPLNSEDTEIRVSGLVYEPPQLGKPMRYRCREHSGWKHIEPPVSAVELLDRSGTRFRVRYFDSPVVLYADLADSTQRVDVHGYQR